MRSLVGNDTSARDDPPLLRPAPADRLARVVRSSRTHPQDAHRSQRPAGCGRRMKGVELARARETPRTRARRAIEYGGVPLPARRQGAPGPGGGTSTSTGGRTRRRATTPPRPSRSDSRSSVSGPLRSLPLRAHDTRRMTRGLSLRLAQNMGAGQSPAHLLTAQAPRGAGACVGPCWAWSIFMGLERTGVPRQSGCKFIPCADRSMN